MINRRELIGALGALPAAAMVGTGKVYAEAAKQLPRRTLGRTGRQVVPLALGGIASLAHPADGLDAADIVVRAVQLGINYLDTANAYGPSQMNYGEAFRRLHLTPSDPSYNLALRQDLYIASKTASRYGLNPDMPHTWEPGPPRSAIDDLKRTMTQLFGDGKGYIPEGAYLDCIQIHNLYQPEHVDQIYEGLAERGSLHRPEKIGAIASLVDYRDGTNYTGLNPERHVWVRHVGVTGHSSSPLLMRAVRLDDQDIFDTVLMALNANDRLYGSNQNNILPLAAARGMGVIAMKIFSDGAMYGGPKNYLSNSRDIIRTVGKPGGVSPKDLVRYPLSLPGVTCAVTGIGVINREKSEEDQLVVNLAGAVSDMPSPLERLRIEKETAERHGTDTNFFQEKRLEIVQPASVVARKDGDRVVVEWNTAFAGPEPIRSYEIRSGERILASVPFRPQLTEAPLRVYVAAAEAGEGTISVIASAALPREKA
jgi:aryl-alcohol dehydrogenase-like predicted oxidoreductase